MQLKLMMKMMWSVCCIKRLQITEQKLHENFLKLMRSV